MPSLFAIETLHFESLDICYNYIVCTTKASILEELHSLDLKEESCHLSRTRWTGEFAWKRCLKENWEMKKLSGSKDQDIDD